MPCTKCEKKLAKLATPDVKRKSEIYLGSGTSSSSVGASGRGGLSSSSSSATLTGRKIGENRYSAPSSCDTCHQKTLSGFKYCQGCAYKAELCAMCGKTLVKDPALKGSAAGRKFSAR